MMEPPRFTPPRESRTDAAASRSPRVTTFASLRNRDYLWYWISQIGAFIGLHMGLIARGWLVWTMTNSELAIGIVSFAFGVPMLLFSVFGGAIVDRMVKRNLLIGTQAFQAIVALCVAILVATDNIELWHLVTAAACGGFLFVLNGPARMAIIPELVSKEQLLNAVALNSSAMNLTRVLGPALAGVLLPVMGIHGVYYLVVASYVASVVALCMVSPPGVTESATISQGTTEHKAGHAVGPRAILADLAEGFRYMRQTPLILFLLVMALIPLTFGLPYMMLLPVFADEVLHVGELGYGVLMAVGGVGALGASLSIASLGDFRRKGTLLIISLAVFGLALILFGLSHSFVLSLVFLAIVGAAGSGYMAVNNTLLQSNVPMRLLGRVMSVYMLTFALMPMGALPVGALAEVIGAPIAVSAGGVLIVIFTVVIAILRPNLRRVE